MLKLIQLPTQCSHVHQISLHLQTNVYVLYFQCCNVWNWWSKVRRQNVSIPAVDMFPERRKHSEILPTPITTTRDTEVSLMSMTNTNMSDKKPGVDCLLLTARTNCDIRAGWRLCFVRYCLLQQPLFWNKTKAMIILTFHNQYKE